MKTLLITGGSSGIGLATVQLFVEKGWQVFELSRSGTSSEGVCHIPCDVTDECSVQSAIEEVMKHTSVIDVVVSNAGFGISGAIEFTSSQEAHRQFDVNFFGAFYLVKHVLPILREQRKGRILFTSSVAADLSIPYQSFYSASKSALNAFALALANEVREFGVKVSVLMPGDVVTGFTDAREKCIEGKSVYKHVEAAVTAMEHDERAGMSPCQMACVLYRMAVCNSLKPIYVGGAMYKVYYVLNKLFPKRFVNWVVGKLYS